MSAFILSMLGLASLGLLVDVIKLDGSSSIDIVFDLICLLVVMTSIVKLLNNIGLLL